jgi:GAF domain-containing protein
MDDKKTTPPLSIDAHENKLIAKSLLAIEQDLDSGRAPAQIKLHYAKMASKQASLEIENLRLKNELLEAKIQAEQAVQKLEAMYEDVIEALKSYTVSGDEY